MKNPDRWSSLFWLVFSIFICAESFRLEIGGFHNPGTGFFPFLAGSVFGIFSLVLFIRSFLYKGEVESILGKMRWKSVILALLSLFLYAIVLEKIGFVISTIFFIGILLRIIERKAWYLVIFVSITSTLLFWVVFQLWLQSQLPKGILGI